VRLPSLAGRATRTRPRFAIVSSPRSANTWLRRLLIELCGLEERAVHTPRELDWDELPERCVLQLHWPRTPAFERLLATHGFHVCVLMRHPLDTLISILHFAGHEPATARWLDGAYGSERGLIGAEPCSQAFLDYCASPRARALIDISAQWWNRRTMARLRFEDLIARPETELRRILRRSGVQPMIEIREAIERQSFSRMREQQGVHEHFWQGEPGLWRRLLPSEYAVAAAAPFRGHARRYRYDLRPDPDLTLEAARQEWRARARPVSIT
jgi:hypothetical protein